MTGEQLLVSSQTCMHSLACTHTFMPPDLSLLSSLPLPTDENAEYLSRLKDLVEEMYNQYQQPVYLLAHSMGCHYVLYFLNHLPQAWKDKYIQGFISLAAPWGGAVKPFRVLASGNSKDMPASIISPKIKQNTADPLNTECIDIFSILYFSYLFY